jgi:hypothetical protein
MKIHKIKMRAFQVASTIGVLMATVASTGAGFKWR